MTMLMGVKMIPLSGWRASWGKKIRDANTP